MPNSKQKGKAGELEIAHILKEKGFDARRGVQYSGGPDSPDVVGIPGIHIEVKRTESFRLWDALEQSINDAGDNEMPVVFHRKNRKQWVVIQPLDDWIDLYENAENVQRQNGQSS